MDPDAVAKAFVEHYYSTFDANRAGLANLYQEGSMLTFEGQKIQGSQSIVAKLTSLPFQQCKHNITTVDCQPSGSGGMLVFVSGNLQLAGEQHALKFSQRGVGRSCVEVLSVLTLNNYLPSPLMLFLATLLDIKENPLPHPPSSPGDIDDFLMVYVFHSRGANLYVFHLC
ncbi:hypothetical protein ES288_D02G183300v1 [Gossypium darwinii]|uniref:NTF2 domain-containing protein n=1 Tax=Gossypium darwinii TaxID=34276 RepID=A0A5D2DEE4_GOSDA|nr:hypothetical protein ES288_D02G183300v1 [Gossypium darwinii]